MGCDVFKPELDVVSFNSYKARLSDQNPDWSQGKIDKQALVGFNTEMFPRQVEAYFSERRGELISHVEQAYYIVNGRLINHYYDFQNMIDYATSKEEEESLRFFERAAVEAKPGEKIRVLDMSGIGQGKGIKYLDTYVKESNDLIRHQERMDLTGNQEGLTLDEAKVVLGRMTEEDVWSKNVDLPQAWSLEVIPPVFTGGGLTEIVKQTPTVLTRADADNNLVFPAVGFWFMVAEALAKNEIEIERTDIRTEEERQTGEEIFESKERTAVSGEVLFQAPIVDSQIFKSLPTAQKNQVVLPTTEVSFKEEIFESKKEPVVKEGVLFQFALPVAASSVETERIEIVKLPALAVEQVEQRVVREVVKSVVSENQDKSLILRQETLFQEVTIGDQDFESVPTELKNQAVLEQELEQNRVIYQADTVIPFRNGIRNGIKEAGGETVRIEIMPHEELVEEKITASQVNREKTVLPIWEIRMQGISLDDIPEWNLSSVLIGEDLGWSMTVPGLKAEEELETNAERAFKLGKWSEFDYLKKTVEVVETILLVIVNTNWEQPPRLRRKVVKDFGGDWGSGSVKHRQIQR